jgi:hypothetical protein
VQDHADISAVHDEHAENTTQTYEPAYDYKHNLYCDDEATGFKG